MQTIDPSGLRAGAPKSQQKSSDKSNPGMQSQAQVTSGGGSGSTNKKSQKMGGGTTKIGTSVGNQKKTNKSRMKTSTSERDNEIVKYGDHIVTPKRLITDKFKELAQVYQGIQQEQAEKEKKLQSSNMGKASSSIVDSGVRSHHQSADKSSGSDVKNSSSNVQEKSSFMDSKRSDDTYSDTESKKDPQDVAEKKHKKQKGLNEEELEEQISVNLGETVTMNLLYIPSSIMQGDPGNENKLSLTNRNQKYEKLLVDKVGSDNYTNRPAQTFNYLPKSKDQQSIRVEKSDTGAFASVWDLYDAQMQDQLNEYEQLQEDIKKNIDKEMISRSKNPFFQLSTQMKAIQIHSQREVPGETQYLEEKLQQGNKTKGGNPTKSHVGQSGGTQQGGLHGGHTNYYMERDESAKDSSSSATGTKPITHQPTNINQYSKSHGRTNQQLKEQQLLIQKKQMYQQLEEEEEVFLKQMVEVAQQQPSEVEQKILSNENLQTSLTYAERILNQNLYHKQYISYRNYPEVKFEKLTMDDDISKRGPGGFRRPVQRYEQEDEGEEEKKTEDSPLNFLFKYCCDLTKDRTVSSADWNPVNQDLLAVSYGEYELQPNVKQPGYVMFWTLKNPTYPERIIKYPSRITCCKFSETNPNLLAAGTCDGIVAIYDIRRKDGKPVAENKEMAGKHNDAVWEVQWVGGAGKGSDKGETLVSISSDSRVVEWSMKKGLEYTDLMSLKRQAHPSQKDNMQEGVNFRWAAGFSFDFLESSMYLVATEEGTVHRCSKSYSEQYLESYFGHSGPIYKVRSNPFFSDIFLTCSADWSCKLWNVKDETAFFNFQSLDLFDEVLDMEWSPHCSTLFASVCKDGRLELWDLTKNNMLDPFASQKPAENGSETWSAKTTVRFGKTCPIIITGDTAGEISVYRLNGYEDCDPRAQSDKLVKLLYPSGYHRGGKERIDS